MVSGVVVGAEVGRDRRCRAALTASIRRSGLSRPGIGAGLGAVLVERDGEREHLPLAGGGDAPQHGGGVDEVERAPLVVGAPPPGVGHAGRELLEVVGQRQGDPLGSAGASVWSATDVKRVLVGRRGGRRAVRGAAAAGPMRSASVDRHPAVEAKNLADLYDLPLLDWAPHRGPPRAGHHPGARHRRARPPHLLAGHDRRRRRPARHGRRGGVVRRRLLVHDRREHPQGTEPGPRSPLHADRRHPRVRPRRRGHGGEGDRSRRAWPPWRPAPRPAAGPPGSTRRAPRSRPSSARRPPARRPGTSTGSRPAGRPPSRRSNPAAPRWTRWTFGDGEA